MRNVNFALLPGLAAVLTSATACAQLVFIPDPVFRAYLQTEHPTVMVGDSLDAAHPDIASITIMIMDCTAPAGNAEGLQYFHSLLSLSASNIGTWPPTLPITLRQLVIRSSSLNDEPPWPNSLEHLHIAYCNVTTPLLLPDSLEFLGSGYSQFSDWPILPTGLDSISFAETEEMLYTTIANTPLPAGLTYLSLHAWGGPMIELPPLVNTQLEFFSPSTPVNSIPDLPSTIRKMPYVHIVGSGCLPDLPEGLTHLGFWNASNIDCLPNMPESMISCSFCPDTICSIWNNPCSAGNRFRGFVYHDQDGDGVRDAGEPGLPGVQVELQPYLVPGISSSSGHYEAVVGAGAWSAQVIPGAYQTPSSNAQTAVFPNATGGVDTGNNLGVVLQPNVHDLSIDISSSMARPGLDNVIWLTCRNAGTVADSGTATLIVDSAQTVLYADPPPQYINGDTVVWAIPALSIGLTHQFLVEVWTDSAAWEGMAVQHQGLVEPMSPDADPSNNMAIHTDTVVASFDPNDKLVSPTVLSMDDVAMGQPVTYTIRFQNTGSAPAANVLIRDLLPAGLEPGSFRSIARSHNCFTQLVGDTLEFFFPGIELPDSGSNEPASHGFVKFSMEPDAALQPGSSVSNEASIFFDVNPAIITPPSVFSVVAPTSIRIVDDVRIGVRPNPARDVIFISTGDQLWTSALVVDELGRVLMTSRSKGDHRLEIAELNQGCYAVVLLEDTGTPLGRARFIKY